MSHLTFKRWDQFNTTVTLRNSDGTPTNITWCTVYFIIRDTSNPDSPNDTDDSVKLTKDITSHTDAVNWVTQIQFLSTDTDIEPWQYFREIQVKFGNDDIYSSATWTITINNDLNKRI